MKKAVKAHFEQIFQKSYISHKAGRFSEAENGYKEILKIKPEWGQPMSALGLLYLDQNRPDKAKPLFEKAAGLNPPDLSASYQLGRLKQIENDHQGAIPLYQQMLEQQPEIGLVWNNLGVALDEQGQAEQALQAYQKAIEIQPDYISPHLNIGIILQKFKRFKEAETHYRKVLESQPENEIAHFMLKSIGGGGTSPDAAPVEHVRSIFNQCAENFEAILVEKLEYKTPELLFHMVRPYLSEDAEKKIYTCLKVFDIMQEWRFPVKFDLIYSSDVFVYFGDLNQIIKSAAGSLVPGGKIAFSVERLENDTKNYQLYPSGRYAHSKNYIQTCLNLHGLKQLELDSTDIRKQSGNPVKGFLVVAGK